MDFQSKAGSTNIGGAFAAAQIAGFNDQVVLWNYYFNCYIPTRLRRGFN
jgi:hypothetical protein